MGATKSYEFSVKENKLAKYAKALGASCKNCDFKPISQKANLCLW